jgi:hypothetical protein
VQFRTGVEEEPTKKWKLKQQFEPFWLATSNDKFYPSGGAIAVAAQPGASRHIGNELDLVAEYEVDKGLNFGFGYARMFAGQFLETTTSGHDYSYPYAYFEYNFSKSGFHFPVTRISETSLSEADDVPTSSPGTCRDADILSATGLHLSLAGSYSAQNTQLSHRALDWNATCFMLLHQGERTCKRHRHTREANRASTSAAATA